MAVMGGSQPKKSKLDSSSSTPRFLPDDVVGEVLLRLPSKSLAKFRCVCRSWERLISSPGFARSHHELAAAKRPTKFTFAPMAPPHSWIMFAGYIVDVPCDECPRVIGPKPCRGLVLFGRRCTRTYSVCNPSTGGILHLPPCLTGFPYFKSNAGIGFHDPTGEYKVVVIAAPTEPQARRCEVLTVGDPAGWRAPAGEESSSMPKSFDLQDMDPVLANGCLHWALGSSPFSKHRGVLSFSLGSESFRRVPLPPFARDDVRRCYLDASNPYSENPRKPAYITGATPVGPALAELDGCLCMVRDLRHRDDVDSTFEIWRLNDYDCGAWSLDYRIDLAQPMTKQLMTTWLVKPLCYLAGDGDSTKTRKMMLATTLQEVHIYDPKTRTLETMASMVDDNNAKHGSSTESSQQYPCLPRSEKENFLRIIMFQESLVHVAGMEYGISQMEYFIV